jgi:hypothetical protein
MFAVFSLYDASDMFCLCTLPWYCKVLILLYDGFKCWQQQRAPQGAGSALDVHTTTLWIFAMQVVAGLVLVGPVVTATPGFGMRTGARRRTGLR